MKFQVATTPYDTVDLDDFKLRASFFEEAKKINPTRKLKIYPADLVVDMARLYLSPPKEGSTLRNTKFTVYTQAAFDIARKVQDVGKVRHQVVWQRLR